MCPETKAALIGVTGALGVWVASQFVDLWRDRRTRKRTRTMLSEEIDGNLRRLKDWQQQAAKSSSFAAGHPMANVQLGGALLQLALPVWVGQRWLNSTELIPVALNPEKIKRVQAFHDRLEALTKLQKQDVPALSKKVSDVKSEVSAILSEGNPLGASRTRQRHATENSEEGTA